LLRKQVHEPKKQAVRQARGTVEIKLQRALRQAELFRQLLYAAKPCRRLFE
jgi:hypothetical protein